MFKTLVLLLLFVELSPTILAKYSRRVEHVGGSVNMYLFKKPEHVRSCHGKYVNSYRKIGWDVLKVETTTADSDVAQARCAGWVEGALTHQAIHVHYTNVVKEWCSGRHKTCSKVYKFLGKHMDWVKQQVAQKGDTDPVWHHVEIFYNQIIGLYAGYSKSQKDPKKKLTLIDFLVMNLLSDLDDVAAAIEGDSLAKERGDTRCSAIVKLLPNNADLLVGHNTWTGYTQMYRMLKSYQMPLNTTSRSGKLIPGSKIVFSGYPGVITSGDDFYVTSANLVAQETTIGNSNTSLWKNVKPTGQLFESVRSLIALRLANNGSSWCKIFSGYNSGTYNNQWMIVDLKKFRKGRVPENGTLWILEQIPGLVHYGDQTPVLRGQGYWASYNTPFYPDIFSLSGNQQLVDKYGDW